MLFTKRPSATLATVITAVVVSATIASRQGLFTPLAAQFGAPPATLGNGVCDPGESFYMYPEENCVAPCGDGYCDNREAGGGQYSCPKDCSRCGDGRCDEQEKSGSPSYCPMDCGDDCGDGMITGNERCDDGNKVNDSDDCTNECIHNICGDGLLYVGVEECDDGNLSDSDSCSSSCKKSVCGDGLVDMDASDGYSEQCDQGPRGGPGCGSDCRFASGGADSPVKPYCKPFEPGFNDVNADRVNVVFVGAGISGTGDLVNAIDISSRQISALEPFASAKDKLQFWYAPDIVPLGEGKDDYTKSCVASCMSNISCPELGKQYVNVLCNRECLSNAQFDGIARISYPDLKDNAGTFAHEFGHQFGELPDEYVKKEIGDWPKQPSCAPSLEKAREWWGKLAGKEDLYLGTIGYYKGCSYDDTNYRPDPGPGNVMFDGRPWSRYGELIHQPYIKRKLDTYSGNPPRPPKPEDDPSKTAAAWQYADFAFPETALRMTLERQSDGGYEVMDSEVVEAPYGVKPTMQSGGAVSVTVGGKEYTQTFSDKRVSLDEDFSDPEGIRFGSYEETPLQTIVVEVGLGDTPPAIAANDLNPVITDCDDNDEISGNDCPAPMFLGAEVMMPTPIESSSFSSRTMSSARSSVAITSEESSSSAVSLVSSSASSFMTAAVDSSSSSASNQSSLDATSSSSSDVSAQSSSADAVHAAAEEPMLNLTLAALVVIIGVTVGGSLVSYVLKRKKA